MNTSQIGSSTARVHLFNNDGNELDFTFSMTGKVYEPVPEIDIDGIADGQDVAVNFGTVELNVPARKVLTVRNSGTATLTLGAISVPPHFSVIEGLRSTLEPGESDTFTVAMETSVAGTFTGAISLASNDADENPYNFSIRGTCATPPTKAPEIAVDGITSGQAAVIDFGGADVNGTRPTKIFTVRNTGTATLTLGAVTLPDRFILVEGQSTSLVAGSTDTFTVALDTSKVGTFSGTVSFLTNDSDESPFRFGIQGQVNALAPEIDIVGVTDGQPIVIDFGSTDQGAAGLSKTFTVRNVGSGALTLGRLSLPSQFSLAGALPTSLAPGRIATLTITLLTNKPGTFSGPLSLENNDANENPYNFGIKGVVAPAGVPRITVVGVADGQATPINLGTVAKGTAKPTRTFTVRNTGTATLTLGNVSVPGNFTVTKAFVSSLAPGASDTFTIAMNTIGEGYFSGDVGVATNDANANSFDFKVEGKVLDISSRYGQVVNWQMVSSQGYLMILKQVSISAGGAKRLYADFIADNGNRILSDVAVGNHGFFGDQGIPLVTVQSSGNYAIAWTNSSSVPQLAGIHYVQMTRFGQFFGAADRVANIAPSNTLTLSGITSDVTTGGFTITWRSGTGKLWKRTFNVAGAPTSGEIAV